MRTQSFISLARAVAAALLAAGCAAGSSDLSVAASRWGSDQASLTNRGGAATLTIAAGSCYGSYGETEQPIPNAQFNLPGVFTQLIGAYPGKLQYVAQFSGTVQGDRMTITVHVPALQQDVGPFTLTRGVNTVWPACAYP
jgi:hypothetical protein